MTRKLVLLAAALALVVALGVVATVVFATPTGQVRITYPYDGSQVSGLLDIKGIVDIQNPAFDFYKVEFGLGENPPGFGAVSSVKTTLPSGEVLDTWDTTKWPNGPVILRLTGVAKDANYLQDQVRVVINNNPQTVGTEACATCHEEQFKVWQETKHGANNVGCEACHGPGGAHVASGGNKAFIGKTYASGSCSTCHGEQYEQWTESAHNNIPASAEFGRSPCVNCHSAQGYVEVNVGGSTSFKIPAHLESQTCAACHNPHSAENVAQLRAVGEVKLPTGEVVQAGIAANCEKCHNQRRDIADITGQVNNSFTRGPHEGTSTDMLWGVGAWDYDNKYIYPSSPHKDVVTNQCVTCHVAPTAGAEANHTFEPQLAACTACHGQLSSPDLAAKADYDGNGAVQGIQEEVEGLMKLIEAELPPMPYTFNRALDTPAKRAAAYNVLFVERDWSKGVHNLLYAVSILQASYKELTGKDVPGATIVYQTGTGEAAAPAAPAAPAPTTAAPAPTTAAPAVAGPPNIPKGHATSGCAVCHATGVAGAPAWPANHATLQEAQCSTCHKPTP